MCCSKLRALCCNCTLHIILSMHVATGGFNDLDARSMQNASTRSAPTLTAWRIHVVYTDQAGLQTVLRSAYVVL